MELKNSPSFPTHILKYIANHEMIGIRAGKKRETFLEIWMVTVGERIFARSWRLSERSWFTTFQKTPFGDLQCGTEIIPVVAVIVGDNDHSLTAAINMAYHKKYNHGDNAYYAKQMIGSPHWERTVELKPWQE